MNLSFAVIALGVLVMVALVGLVVALVVVASAGRARRDRQAGLAAPDARPVSPPHG